MKTRDKLMAFVKYGGWVKTFGQEGERERDRQTDRQTDRD